MPTWLISLVINYILSQLANLGTSVDWNAITAEADTFVNKFVPSFLQPSVDGVVAGAVQVIAAACQDTADLELIVGDLEAKNWAQALTDLEALIAKLVKPAAPTAPVVAALHALKAA